MKTNKQFVCLAALLLVLSSCKKDKPQIKSGQGELQTVSFHLSGFKAEITPLGSASAQTGPPRFLSAASNQRININPDTEPQFVYFWSFNNEDLVPDISADDGAEITFVASNTEPDFVGGYSLSPYADAGQAFSTKETSSINVKFPLGGVNDVSLLEFDAGSSGTGPKDFKISYSVNGGTSFQLLQNSNPLEGDSRSRYEYALDGIPAIQNANSLEIKIELVPGSRPSTGTFRLDNIRLTGIYDGTGTGNDDPENPTAISKIHYYLFDTAADTLATSGNSSFDPQDPQPSLSVQLIPGTYSAIFLSNVSDQELLLPSSLHEAIDFFTGNHFDNGQAEIFGTRLDDIEVAEQPVDQDATLSRFYSNIAFHFTDESGLASVKRITINRGHTNFWYTPFGTPGSLPTEATDQLTFTNPFEEEATLSFNEFMGDLETAAPIAYTVNAYDANDQLLRTFTVSSAIKNNVQLLFTGELLDGGNNTDGGFTLSFNPEWDVPVNETF